MGYRWLGPALSEQANSEESWQVHLQTRCSLLGQCEDVSWYCYCNQHYIVFKGRVLRAYGYHGERLYTIFCDPQKRKEWITAVQKLKNDLYVRHHDTPAIWQEKQEKIRSFLLSCQTYDVPGFPGARKAAYDLLPYLDDPSTWNEHIAAYREQHGWNPVTAYCEDQFQPLR